MEPVFNSGSNWHRWDPHIHTPGTVLNDQFGDEWGPYLDRIEQSEPKIKALGVTDYYLTDSYQRVVREKNAGRLQDVDLIFPNIEMRLDIGTSAGVWTNIHLLVCPDEPDHLMKAKQFLGQLQFQAADQIYVCDRNGLISLGQSNGIEDEKAALRRGAEQFKVNIDSLRRAYEANEWAKKNILVAVPGGADGTSGVGAPADQTLRNKIEAFAHIIFSANPRDRVFWLGESKASVSELEANHGGLKPCLHGSDAHRPEEVGQPDLNRYCWIKATPSFDGLRYACIAPHRAYIGKAPPTHTIPSQTIKSVSIVDAPWIETPNLEFNAGLVTIIGARGSGKTALADIIAAGCDATRTDDRSFLSRASEKLGNASVKLARANEIEVTHLLSGSAEGDERKEPTATYLSQQFVERLCAADGLADDLLREIERVIFESHDATTKGLAHNFNTLKDNMIGSASRRRRDANSAIADLSERIGDAYQARAKIGPVEQQIQKQDDTVKNYETDRQSLIPSGADTHLTRLNKVSNAITTVSQRINALSDQINALNDLQSEVGRFREQTAPALLCDLRVRFATAGLSDKEWEGFRASFTGDVDALLKSKLKPLQEEYGEGNFAELPTGDKDDSRPLISDGADLNQQPLWRLRQEADRLRLVVGEDEAASQKFNAMSKRVAQETRRLEGLKRTLKQHKDSADQIESLRKQRSEKLGIVVEAVLSEETALKAIYKPLEKKLSSDAGILEKLTLSVNRNIDLKDWAERGEALLDLRKAGEFRGRGTLLEKANAELLNAWQTGDVCEILTALNEFRGNHTSKLLDQSPFEPSQSDSMERRNWLTQFAKWIFDTSYVSFHYSMEYDGADIRQLSPGNRGIVLLLLYLALDEQNDKPLIIDQPEENLDPKSIHNELVPLFERAKERRQIFMVTHNANLVVNTDADQVIIATAGDRQGSDLPPISYKSGGLEDTDIRQAVCEVLEGGEVAFRERAKRLQIALSR